MPKEEVLDLLRIFCKGKKKQRNKIKQISNELRYDVMIKQFNIIFKVDVTVVKL